MAIKKLLFYALSLLIACFLNTGDAMAQYKRLTIQSGAQYFNSSDMVTVSFSGQPLTFTGSYLCGYGPYQIGYYVDVFFFQLYSPLSYTFTFNQPVKHLRIDVGDLTNIDIASIDINNIPYVLTNSNLGPPPHQDQCLRDTAVIQGGSISAPPSYPPAGPIFTAARLSIKEPLGITSAKVAFTGTILTNGYSGTYFSFYFGAIDAKNNGPRCAGDSLQLYGDSTITEPGTFNWTGPNGFNSQQQNPVIYPLTPADTGIYTLTYITGIDTLTDTTHVALLPGPNIPYITGDSVLCANDNLLLDAVTTPGAQYTWNGPDGFTAPGPSLHIPGIQPAQSGKYTIMASQFGCTPTATKEIVVQPTLSHKFTKVVCAADGYDFNGTLLFQSGNYSDTFPATNGCDSIISLNLVVLPAPLVHINTEEKRLLCIGDTLLLMAEGDADRYTWQNSDGNIIGIENNLQFPLSHASNRIVLIGTSANNCTDTASLTLNGTGCCTLFLPNAFSPNEDGRNDFFAPATEGHLKQYQLTIFNRWGQQVFTSFQIATGWDGRINGMPADGGTYHYLITGQCLEQTKIKEAGDLILMR